MTEYLSAMNTYLGGRLEVIVGDITKIRADAIVNAANSSLLGGGGVDGAIHRAGGPSILAECRKLRETTYPDGLPTGEAVATTAGNLSARIVIHTVGPVWHGGGHCEEVLLSNCYTNALRIAAAESCATIVFPAISTGVYGFPRDYAARISSHTVSAFLDTDETIQRVFFVFFDNEDARIFEREQLFKTTGQSLSHNTHHN
jgi:O-acetyl-ADP-ribose deacetylase